MIKKIGRVFVSALLACSLCFPSMAFANAANAEETAVSGGAGAATADASQLAGVAADVSTADAEQPGEGAAAGVEAAKQQNGGTEQLSGGTAALLNEATESERDTAQTGEKLAFVYIDEASLSLGNTQYIAVMLDNESLQLAQARLLVDSPSGAELELTASSFAENAALFELTCTELGTYSLRAVLYTAANDEVEKCTSLLEEGLSFEVTQAQNTSVVNVQASDAPSQVTSLYGLNENDEVSALSVQDLEELAADAMPASQDTAVAAVASYSLLALAQETGPKMMPLVIALDPGHGGYDGGAQSGGLQESVLNWKIAVACKKYLEAYANVSVVLTRDESEYVGLTERVDRAAEAGANVIVSLHNNANGSAAGGCEVYYPNNSSWMYEETHVKGKELAQSIQDKLVALGLTNRGIKVRNCTTGDVYVDGSLMDYYTVISAAREQGIPAIIVEHAFIDSAVDAERLADDAFLDALGKADSDGIAEAFGLTTGEWQQDEQGWRFYVDGQVQCNGWFYIMNSWYYFDEEGYPLKGWQTFDGKCYYLDPAYYGAAATGVREVEGKYYFFNSKGVMGVSDWNAYKGSYCWSKQDGTLASGWYKVADGMFYFNPETKLMLRGWFEDAEGRHWLQDGGSAASGWLLIDETWYYFDSEKETHPAKTGLFTLEGTRYYCDETGALAVSEDVAIGNSVYRADASGALTLLSGPGEEDGTGPTDSVEVEGWNLDGTGYYYLKNGVRQTGWLQDASGWHWIENSGYAAQDWKRLGGSWYYFDPLAVGCPAKTGFFSPCDDTRWFYADEVGRMKTSWIQDEKGAWHFAKNNGEMLSGFQTLGGSIYYFDPEIDAHPAKRGLFSVGEKLYYANETGQLVVSERITVDGTMYDADENGVLTRVSLTGWFKDDAGYYYLKEDVRQTGWIQDSAGWHFVASNGYALEGWQYLGVNWYYFDPREEGCPAQVGFFVPVNDNRWFYADEVGRMKTSWIQDEKGAWHFAKNNGEMLSSWQYLGASWYYFDPREEGCPARVGFFVPANDDRWFYADEVGRMKTSWIQDEKGAWHFAKKNGEMLVGFNDLGGSTYYFDSTLEGSPARRALFEVAGNQYYADEIGRILKSQQIEIDGVRYEADANGVLAIIPTGTETGWLHDDAGYYYVKEGVAQTGWLQDANGWHWLEEGGYAASGWKYLGGSWFYFDPDANTHPALTGFFTVNGELFYADSSARLYVSRYFIENAVNYFADDRGSVTETDFDSLYAISGTTTVSVDQMIAAYQKSGAAYPAEELAKGGAPTIRDFCTILYEEACIENIKPEVVFVQAMLETGWLKFGGDVQISQFNFAGLGATGGGVQGNSFPDVRTGLRAQVQHLKAYASTDALVQKCVDTRFQYVVRGVSPYVEWLGMKENPWGKGWAAGKNYGFNLLRVIQTYL